MPVKSCVSRRDLDANEKIKFQEIERYRKVITKKLIDENDEYADLIDKVQKRRWKV
jgi:hypothetical protein